VANSNSPFIGAVQRRVLFIEDVATLIGKSATTIRTCSTNLKYAHLIPRPWKMPGSRRLCWYQDDVLAWIDSCRPAEPPPPKRPRGRPTKAEQLARQRWAATAGGADRGQQGGR
jgi:predicted DNA-binding transcriptional regulator AlpA